MGKFKQQLCSVGKNYLSIPKLQRDHFSMLVFKLNYASKKGLNVCLLQNL